MTRGALAMAVLLCGCQVFYPFNYGEGASCDPECGAGDTCVASVCTQIVDIEGGESFGCTLTADGRVLCWGVNGSGQLGEAGSDRAYAAGVTLATERSLTAIELGVGDRHACAVADNGRVLCWGSNQEGQLGVGNRMEYAGPIEVRGVNDATQVACGSNHCCALDASGVSCWGENRSGQLGTGNTESSEEAVRTLVLDGTVSRLYAAGDQSCALMPSRDVLCWGRNSNGQLGLGDRNNRVEPTPIELPDPVLDFEMGSYHACAVVEAPGGGQLYCWGSNGSGQLGNGGTSEEYSPTLIDEFDTRTEVDDVLEVALGDAHTCVVRDTEPRRSWCWGSNRRGQVGDPDEPEILTKPVRLAQTVEALGAGDYFTCGLREGALVCWGWDNAGQLGSGIPIVQPAPMPVPGVEDAREVIASLNHTCVVRGETRLLACFGSNEYGELGIGTRSPVSVPTRVGSLTDVVAVDADSTHTCALTGSTGSHAVFCWGRNWEGQLARSGGSEELQPIRVGFGSGEDPIDVAAGEAHSCALIESAGTVGYRCWGSNGSGAVGNGTTDGRFESPERFTELPGVGGEGEIGAGQGFTCASRGGTVSCWGWNQGGRLGLDSGSEYGAPQENGATGIERLDVGQDATCGVAAGDVLCWGTNGGGNIGPDPEQDVDTPSPLGASLGAPVVQVSVGDDHLCALTDAGAVHCRGDNLYGELGRDESGEGLPFGEVQLPEAAGPTVAIAAGVHHTCAMQESGAVYCWGYDLDGRLGTGRPLRVLEPSPVAYASP